MGAANNCIAGVDIFKGGTWLEGAEDHNLNSWLARAETPVSSSRSGGWELSGWHYADWDAGTVEDSTSTYDSATGLLSSPKIADDYRAANRAMSNWTAVSYADSSAGLKSVLGHKAGVAVDRLFHTTLAANLVVGDKVPCMLLSPDGAKAVALFSHEDGSTTEIGINIHGGKPSVASTRILGLGTTR